MVADPSLGIQGAFVAALKADPDVAAIVGDRVYDRVPGPDPTFPYVMLGDVLRLRCRGDARTNTPSGAEDAANNIWIGEGERLAVSSGSNHGISGPPCP